MTKQVTAQDIQNSVRFTTFSASQKWMKLTAQEQRSLFFGFAPFGRKALKVTETGIKTKIIVAFGQDYDTQNYTWEQVARMVNEQKRCDYLYYR